LGGGSRSGAGPHFVAEACEFNRSFHSLHPKLGIITNIEEDHLDCYKDIHEIVESFLSFAALVPADGRIITSALDGNCVRALTDVKARVERVALQPGYEWFTDPRENPTGCWDGTVRCNGQVVAELRLRVAGRHNLMNAT
ncbi:MAG TPA: Mur ligase family protein, partial [Tepidisphaeraceae bacterium]|nr:Mur ligase family protein [Tepidisphaeraceae bacterium]